jgi:predicted AlkP superfamily phosphohydrolase/phosphomutase
MKKPSNNKTNPIASLFGAALILLLLFSMGACRPATPTRHTGRKLVILGFDGVDPNLMQKWMEAGHLPHIKKMLEAGTFRKLGTTNPPESPVAWATFATGLNPGQHGIFDFIGRNPDTYMPEIALATVISPRYLLGTLPLQAARVINHRQGVPFYKQLADAGIKTTVLRMPLEFPPTPLPGGKLLGGLNIPDIRGTWGTFHFFSTALSRWETDSTEFGGKLVRLEMKGQRADAFIEGPLDPLRTDGKRITLPINLDLNVENKQVRIQAGGQQETLQEGHWSRWFNFSFPVNFWLKLHGTGRFYVSQLYPEVEIYLSPINLDPEQPPYPISSPPNYASSLKKTVGFYKTLGWPYDTWGLNEERIDERTFLEDVEQTTKEHAALLFHELDKDPADCTVAIFTAPDSVSHMLFRLLDPQHPRYDAQAAASYGDAILRTYEQMDQIIGEVQTRISQETTLLVVSDHGFHSFRKGFNTNSWLVEQGLMKLKGGTPSSPAYNPSSFFPNVDWAGTEAYAVGLGQIYVNLKGRERQGILERGTFRYEEIIQQIITGLEKSRDPDTGEKIIEKVYRNTDIYRGKMTEGSAELRLAFYPGYRTSWETTLGGVPQGLVSANLKKWSGDHSASDPADTPGILLCNRSLTSNQVSIADIAPTVLEYFHLPVPREIDGKAFPLPANR